ncbi:MAG: RimK family alpha-L-glutamate ligase [Sulfuriferula sp.]|nr:RimK family alpha-L-glutamate ligase [Sulfuriferula sp.]
MTNTLPVLTEMELHPIVSMATLARIPHAQIQGMIAQMLATTSDANLFMGLSQLLTIVGNAAFASEMQAKAFDRSLLYRVAGNPNPGIKLLALMGPGDMLDNTPLDYLVENSDIRLDILYIVPGKPLPATIPEHDVVIVALCESDKNEQVMQMLEGMVKHWPRPVLNLPECIRLCTRERIYQQLAAIPGLTMPPTIKLERQELERVIALELPVTALFHGACYPITIRPCNTHRGEGLSRVENAAELAAYLDKAPEQEFHISLYVDYRSADGLYRKARIALIDGLPYVCHLAISEHWIVHYVSAKMDESSAKRADEADFMNGFETGFALRHRDALFAIGNRLGLDYVVIDCAETTAGELLIFEIDNRGWVHALDPVDLFSYKQAPMSELFAAFRRMLLKAKNSDGNPDKM